MNECNRKKIDSALRETIGSNFIIFPEYTYTDELEESYKDYSNQNNCIII